MTGNVDRPVNRFRRQGERNPRKASMPKGATRMTNSARSPGTPLLELGALQPGEDSLVCPAPSGAARVGSEAGVGGTEAGAGPGVVGAGAAPVGVGFGVAVGGAGVGAGVGVGGGGVGVGVGEGCGVAVGLFGKASSGSSGRGQGSKPVAVRHRLSRPRRSSP